MAKSGCLRNALATSKKSDFRTCETINNGVCHEERIVSIKQGWGVRKRKSHFFYQTKHKTNYIGLL